MQNASGQTTPSSGIASRISKCPTCGYSWNGLPDEGACPECGLAFDQQSNVWKMSARVSTIFLTALCLFLALASTCVVPEMFPGSDVWGSLVALFFIVLAFWISVYILRSLWKSVYIASMKNVVLLKPSDKMTPDLVPWEQVYRIEVRRRWFEPTFVVLAGPKRTTYGFRCSRASTWRAIIENIRRRVPNVQVCRIKEKELTNSHRCRSHRDSESPADGVDTRSAR